MRRPHAPPVPNRLYYYSCGSFLLLLVHYYICSTFAYLVLGNSYSCFFQQKSHACSNRIANLILLFILVCLLLCLLHYAKLQYRILLTTAAIPLFGDTPTSRPLARPTYSMFWFPPPPTTLMAGRVPLCCCSNPQKTPF